VDVRFIAATHQDLEAAVARGTFREDLYFRINGFTLTIPPLRERVAEIAALSQHFIQHFASEQGRPPPALTPEAQALLEKHPWPGNIRELRNVMGRAAVLCQGEAIEAEHLIFDSSQRVRVPMPPVTPAPVLSPPQASAHPTPIRTPSVASEPHLPPTPVPVSTGGRLGDDIAALERQRILAALDQCGGNQTRAAEVLGISRRTLVTRLGVYGIPRPRSR
jgi:DNA-binding NtrC family response regulator